jgi:hypothetical protein
VLGVLGASADGLGMLKPSEVDWVLTTAVVVLAAIGLVPFVVFRVTRLSKQEAERLRTAFTMVLDAANEELNKSGPGWILGSATWPDYTWVYGRTGQIFGKHS